MQSSRNFFVPIVLGLMATLAAASGARGQDPSPLQSPIARPNGAAHDRSARTPKLKAIEPKLNSGVPAKAEKAASPAAAESAPVPSLPAGFQNEAVGEMQPLSQARSAGIALCLDTLTRETSLAIDGVHDAFSTWSATKPDEHTFSSIVSLRYNNQTVPRAVAILIAAPRPDHGCDGITVQIVPTARSCGAIQTALLNDGKVIANLTGLPLIENKGGMRHILLPTAGNGCTIVVVSALAAN